MSLSSSSMEMNGNLKELRVRWQEARAVWNDSVGRDFEENHWLPLEARVLAALRAIERLAPVLDKLKQQCGESSAWE